MTQNHKGNFLKYVQVTTTFGITTAFRIYILGILAGGWLDQKFVTSPWFMLLGVLLAVFLSFKSLLEQLSRVDNTKQTKEK
ncbi:MAG: AtpZ/AtpI family protein [Bacillota bacterium]